MDETAIREKTASVLARVSGYDDDDFKLSDKLRDDLGMDSLEFANLEVQLEDALNINTESVRWNEIHTVKDLQDKMVALVAG